MTPSRSSPATGDASRRLLTAVARITALLLLLIAPGLRAQQAQPHPKIPQGKIITTQSGPPAPQPHDPILDQYARVTSVSIGEPGRSQTQINIDVQNLSKKTITGFYLALVLHYAHGDDRRMWPVGADLLPNSIPDLTGHTPFVGGSIYRFQSDAILDQDRLPPTSVTAEISALLFDDRTAIGDGRAIEIFLTLRKNDAQKIAELLKEIEAAQAEPEIRSAFAAGKPEAVSMLQKRIASRVVHPLTDGNGAFWVEHTLHAFSRFLAGGKSVFDSELAKYTALHRITAEGSILQGGGK